MITAERLPDGTAPLASPGPPHLRFAVRVAAVALIAYLPVPVSAWVGGTAGWILAAGVAVALTLVPRLIDREVLVCALLPAAALTLSSLVTASGEYLAMSAVGGALVARYLLDHRSRPAGALESPVPRPALVFVVAYTAWAGISTVTSTEHRTSLVYLVGMAFSLAIAFWVVPSALTTPLARRRLLTTVVVLALAAVSVDLLLSVTGPLWLYGRSFGSVLMIEPTLFKRSTGLVLPRTFGPYVDQGPWYTLIAFGMIACWALRGHARLPATGAAVVLAAALLVTYSRAGWLIAVTAAVLWGAATLWRRRPDRFAIAIGALFTAVLVALLLNVLGANARFDVQADRGWPVYVVAGQLTSSKDLKRLGVTGSQMRGGADLSERDVLWRASLHAAERRPVLGHGPGTDADAIAGFLPSSYAVYRGISSHSTWLRTLVEMGVPGLALLGVIWLFIGLLAVRALRRRPTLADDVTLVGLVVIAYASFPDQFFEIYLFGGFGFPNLLVAIAMALAAAQAGTAGRVAVRQSAVTGAVEALAR